MVKSRFMIIIILSATVWSYSAFGIEDMGQPSSGNDDMTAVIVSLVVDTEMGTAAVHGLNKIKQALQEKGFEYE